MVLEGRVTYNADPMAIAVRGMTTQIHMMNYYTDNIAHSTLPGYQKKVPVVTSFADHLGWKAIDTVTDTSPGQIRSSKRPLDFAVNGQGYFQKLHEDGRVELTRDGRFKLDKDGRLLSEDNMPVLSRQGTPIVLPFIPDKLSQIKVSPDGWMKITANDGKTTPVAQLAVAGQDGRTVDNIDVRQGYVEESNVFMHEEFVAMTIPRRNFQANRQIFLTQSQALGRLIQEMGRSQ